MDVSWIPGDTHMRIILKLVLTVVVGLIAVPAMAGPPRVKPATAGPKTPKAPKVAVTTTPKARPVTSSPKGPKAPNTTGPKSVASAKPVTSTKPTTKAPKAPKTAAVPETTVETGVVAPVGKSAVPKNPKLVARLQAMLPPGMTVEQAALGFKNQGQFIAAVNVARNKGIPFVDLKTSMVDGGLSLGQSIQQLKPALNGDVEAARATRWAEQQLESR
jgi:hypothetical protein